jgi:aspartyl-tRNA synthetase
LRDREGLVQVVCDPDRADVFKAAESVRNEFCLRITGIVRNRPEGTSNANLASGKIEVLAHELEVLNPSVTPPFQLDDDNLSETTRLTHRVLDLRRPQMQNNLRLRYKVTMEVRKFLDANGFIDIETPMLTKSTPEGARDYLVPSRVNAGHFFALPQSPQLFKQLLMVANFDRYYQITKCFRDEDLRADRQPEFTQIDCEMAFVEQEDILNMFEGLVKYIFKEVKRIDYTEPVQRMSWEEAMWTYGNDKPDIRFDMKLANLKSAFNKDGRISATGELVSGAGFGVFDKAETVLAIAVPGAAEYTRKQIDELTDWVKRPQIGMQGMVYIRVNQDGSHKSSIDKFYGEDRLKAISKFAGARPGDLVLILAGPEERTRKAISELRLELGERLGFRKKDQFKLLWVLDFPLFEYAEEDNRWVARHHPFTSPKPSQIDLMINNSPLIENAAEYLKHPYAHIKANAYDMVLNGNEIGGGSIRIFQRALQEKMFAALGMSTEEALHKFGFLLGAFEYGAPPHGGIAFGFDRLCAILGGSESIRDFIAFPKNNSGRDVMLDAPSTIDEKQLDELNIKLDLK